MKHAVLGLVLFAAGGSAAADSGKIKVSLTGDAKVTTWTREGLSWQELSGQLSVDNGLSVPLEGLRLQLVYLTRIPLAPGDTPFSKAGQDEATIWFPTAIAAGASQEVPLKVTVHNVPVAGLSKGLELDPLAALTGKHKAHVVSAPSPPTPEGIQATAQASEVDVWLEIAGLAKAAPSYSLHAEGDVKVQIDNHGQRALRSLTVVSVVDGRDVAFPDYATQWGNRFLMPGKSDTPALSLHLDRSVPDSAAAIVAELPLTLAARNLVFGVDPAPVMVQESAALKASAKGGATVAKLRRGDFVVEVADGDPTEVRTVGGARGYLPQRVLQVPLVVHGKKIKKALAKQTADGLYIELCGEARAALGLYWDDMGGFTLKAGQNKLHLSYRGGPGKLTTAAGEREVVLDPVPYGKAGGCGTVHEHTLHELGIDLR